MKRWILVTMLLSWLLLATYAVTAQSSAVPLGSSLDANLLTYQPVPVQPGDLVTVWIQVVNNGGSESKGGTVTIIDSPPFSVEAADQVNNFSTIPPQSSFLIQAQIRVDKNANEGTNTLKVRVQETGNGNYIERDLPLTVQERSGIISVVNATTTPEPIVPGGTGTVTLQLQNIGSTQLRNVAVALNLAGLSIAPTSGSTSETIDVLPGGAEANFAFDIITFPNAALQAYQVPVTISYQDEQGITQTQNETIGIVIGAAPELLVYFEQVNIPQATKEGPVTIEFANKGLSQIKFLQMTVIQNDDVKVTSESPTLYVGNIDPDDYQSGQVTLKLSKQSVEVPINVSYRDALNQPYTETVMLNLTASDGSSSSGSTWWIIIIVLLIIGGAAWFIMSKRRHHKAK